MAWFHILHAISRPRGRLNHEGRERKTVKDESIDPLFELGNFELGNFELGNFAVDRQARLQISEFHAGQQ